MTTRRLKGAGAAAAACVVLALPPDAQGQARRRGDSGNPHLLHRKRLSHSAAPGPAEPGNALGNDWNAAQSSFIVSADSLAWIAYSRTHIETDQGSSHAEASLSGLSVGLLRGSSSRLLEQPRVAFDGVVGPGITLGASLGYEVFSGEERTIESANGVSNEDTDERVASSLMFVPRAGWLLPASRYVSIWLRAGVCFTRITSRDNAEDPRRIMTSFGLLLDPMVVVSPLPHVGLLFGPSLNVGLAGSLTRDPDAGQPDVSLTHSSYGASAGLALLF